MRCAPDLPVSIALGQRGGEEEVIYYGGQNTTDEQVAAVASALTRSGFTYADLPYPTDEDWGHPIAT